MSDKVNGATVTDISPPKDVDPKTKRLLKNQQSRSTMQQIQATAVKEVAVKAHETAQSAIRLLRDFLTEQLRVTAVVCDGVEFVVINHKPGFELRDEICESLSKLLGGKSILIVPEGLSVDLLDEATLDRHGWQKKPRLYDAEGNALQK